MLYRCMHNISPEWPTGISSMMNCDVWVILPSLHTQLEESSNIILPIVGTILVAYNDTIIDICSGATSKISNKHEQQTRRRPHDEKSYHVISNTRVFNSVLNKNYFNFKSKSRSDDSIIIACDIMLVPIYTYSINLSFFYC